MNGRLLQLAWRNLWRNRRRTFITMAAIAFGYAMLLFVACLMAGLRWQMIQNGTCLVMSQIQVHAPGYYPNRSLQKTIGGRQGTDVSALLASIASDRRVNAVSSAGLRIRLAECRPSLRWSGAYGSRTRSGT